MGRKTAACPEPHSCFTKWKLKSFAEKDTDTDSWTPKRGLQFIWDTPHIWRQNQNSRASQIWLLSIKAINLCLHKCPDVCFFFNTKTVNYCPLNDSRDQRTCMNNAYLNNASDRCHSNLLKTYLDCHWWYYKTLTSRSKCLKFHGIKEFYSLLGMSANC